MRFLIDTVSEFTYFQNMLLGLAKALKKSVGVKNTHLRISYPLTDSEIKEWESEAGVILSEDLRHFYSSSNGFKFEWTYTFGDEVVVAKIEVNTLGDLIRVYGYETTNDPGVNVNRDRYILKLAPESKVFELNMLPERAKVVLVYLYPEYVPSIWVLTPSMHFFYLADDIAAYLRMCIIHLGIPNWQLAYTTEEMPQWSANMFRMLVPHMLPFNKRLEAMRKERKSKKHDKDFTDIPVNKLDPAIFEDLKLVDSGNVTMQEPKGMKKKLRPQTTSLVLHCEDRTDSQQNFMKKLKRKPLYYVKK